MASKSYLGIDFGHNSLKMAWVKNGAVKKLVDAQMPENLIKDGQIVSIASLAELIKTTMKENGIKEKYAAVVLSTENAFVRNVSLPVMTADQLLYNLPFEFRDYFTEELHEYMFDYAMYSTPDEILKSETSEDGEEANNAMHMLAVAVKKELIAELKELLAKCGLKADIIAPTVSAYRNIIRGYEKHAKESDEYCILDLGHKSIRMNIFSSEHHNATRELENGISLVEDAIALEKNVDKHLAHTYILNNYENCQNTEACNDVYNSIGVEIMRALNFYQFSNQGTKLNKIYVSGGGSEIKPMISVLREIITDYEMVDAAELLPKNAGPADDVNEMFLAIGIAMGI